MCPKYPAYLLAVVLVWMISGCENNTLVIHSFEDSCWEINDTLRYKDLSADKIGLQITFGDAYRYRNFYLRVVLESASGTHIDTLLNDTLNDVEGNWYDAPGKDLHPHVFRDTLLLKGAQSYSLNLFHYMRDSSICQVNSIAVVSF